jgi:hypothetical protein
MNKYAIALILFYIMFAWAGCKKDTVRFFPLKPSGGDTVVLSGIYSTERTDSAWKSVFLDFSKDIQTGVLRSSWDLGFYCGTDDYRVIINHALGATAFQLTKTNLNDVVPSDTAALVANHKLVLNADTGDITTVDKVEGDKAAYLAGTVIKAISASSSQNNVYIIKRGMNTNLRYYKWIKVKIDRTNNGYIVTYGNMIDNNNLYTSFTVIKDASYNFRYASFSSRTANYEPAKALWDICWGYNTYVAINPDGTKITNPDGTFRAQPQPDFIQLNFMGGVTAAEVIFGADTTKNYRNFREADTAGVTFSGNRDVIGANWRKLSESNLGALSVRTDRFYLVKDSKRNIYKVSFAAGGSRGNPIVSYTILHDAETSN